MFCMALDNMHSSKHVITMRFGNDIARQMYGISVFNKDEKRNLPPACVQIMDAIHIDSGQSSLPAMLKSNIYREARDRNYMCMYFES